MLPMVARLRIALSSLLLASLAGCSGGSQVPKCIPGESAKCYCPTGQQGAQTCTSTGSFAACVCLPATADAGAVDGSDSAATSPPDAPAATGGSDGLAEMDGAEGNDAPFATGLQGVFAPTGSMNVARDYHTATLLPSGMVLIAGGTDVSDAGVSTSLASAEIFDPAAGTFTATGSMAVARDGHTATLLPSGMVLIAGGDRDGGPLASAELFDPAAGTLAATGNMIMARLGHMATLLPSGKVLITGGWGPGYLASAELYDPGAGTCAATGHMTAARAWHTATLLPDGKILTAGGVYLASAELYDPAAGTFTATGSMAVARQGHTATLLPSGMVLIAGGLDNTLNLVASAELYDPAAGTFAATGSMAAAREFHTATLLSNGMVLIAGGLGTSGYLAGAELYE